MKKNGNVEPDQGSFLAVCYDCVHYISWAVIGLLLLFGIAVGLLQSGLADRFISEYSRQTFKNIVGESQNINIEKTALRLSGDGRLSVEAREFSFAGGAQTQMAYELLVDRAQMKVDPLTLAKGNTTISAVDISNVDINLTPTQKANSDPQSFAMPKIQDLDNIIEMIFSRIESAEMNNILRDAEEITFENIWIHHPAFDRFDGLLIREASVIRTDRYLSRLEGMIQLGEDEFPLTIERDASTDDQTISGSIGKFALKFETNDPDPQFRSGLDTSIFAKFDLRRAGDNNLPEFRLSLDIDPGDLKMGGEVAQLKNSQLNWFYDAGKKAIELAHSDLVVAKSVFPISGGLIDSDNFNKARKDAGVGDISTDKKDGVVFDFVIGEGVLAPIDTNEVPIIFSAKAFGHYSFDRRELNAEELVIATGGKYAAGNAIFRFLGKGSPELNIAIQVPEIQTAVAKQFWPFWLGRGTRGWATNNIFGGTIKNANLYLHVEAGRFANPIRPIKHREQDYQVDYDFSNARVNIVGDVPPVRSASGHMKLRGTKVVVSVDKGTSYFASGRKMDILDGTITIPDNNQVPLMADVDFNLTGWADAAAELISFQPIDALDDIGITPDQISGLVDAHVVARLGLINDQNPPDPVWQVELALNGVDLSIPIENRILTNVTGSVDVNRDRAIFDTKLKMDGVNVNAKAVEPIGNSGVARKLSLNGVMSAKDRTNLGLDINDIVVGNTGFKLERIADNQNKVEINFTNAVVIAPGTAWKKSKGVPAKATFILSENGDAASLRNFKFSGKGFSASGALDLDEDGLKTAKFTNVKLSPKDNYRFDVTRKGNGYKINMTGKSFDMRPLINQLKADETSSQKYDGRQASIDLTGKIDQVHGFGNEVLTLSTMKYSERGGIPLLAEFAGRTRASGSVAVRLKGDISGEKTSDVITVASDDSGSFWRFFDIYAFVQGGAVDMRLTKTDNGPYIGNVNMRNFKVIGDERLKTLVATRASAKERSLNEALKGRLDVSRVNFTQAIISVRLNEGQLDITEGIVRGPQIGAAFDGMLYDSKDNTDISGTFMPAYALNSFFGEIPILGALLGNGKDKALFGITFRVSGNADNPRIQVNPLSIIAPGIFRSIFEF